MSEEKKPLLFIIPIMTLGFVPLMKMTFFKGSETKDLAVSELKTGAMGSGLEIIGLTTNSSGRTWSGITAEAEFFDSSGDFVDEASQYLRSEISAHLSLMAGAFETISGNNHYLEANVKNHIASMQTLANKWPDSVPAIWSGFKIGISAAYPRESIATDFNYVDHHIVKESYLLHSGPNHDRPTWDLTSVLYSVLPDREYFDFSVKGRVSVEEDGFTTFTRPRGKVTPPFDRDRYLLMSDKQAARVQEALVHLVAQPPAER